MNKTNNKYSFIGHLEILRWHLLRSVIASVICSLIVFFNKSLVFDKIIFACYHPSPRNINTKVVTRKMITNLFVEAKKIAKF